MTNIKAGDKFYVSCNFYHVSTEKDYTCIGVLPSTAYPNNPYVYFMDDRGKVKGLDESYCIKIETEVADEEIEEEEEYEEFEDFEDFEYFNSGEATEISCKTFGLSCKECKACESWEDYEDTCEDCEGLEDYDKLDDELDAKLPSQFERQEAGTHYQKILIQPLEYILANNLPFCEGNVVKYISRFKNKNGAEDLKKVIHYTQFLLEKEYGILSKVEYGEK